MPDDLSGLKQQMDALWEQAFRQREAKSYDVTANIQRAAGEAETATQTAKRELEEVNKAIAVARTQHTQAVEQGATAEARLATTEDRIAAAELKLRAVQDIHRDLVGKMTAAASA